LNRRGSALKEQLLRVTYFRNVEEPRLALLAFKETYNWEWLIARLEYRSPAHVRQAFAVRPAA
jgi:putative transposase